LNSVYLHVFFLCSYLLFIHFSLFHCLLPSLLVSFSLSSISFSTLASFFSHCTLKFGRWQATWRTVAARKGNDWMNMQ
jgi:hypothetical protein